jgi:hypothetical protein
MPGHGRFEDRGRNPRYLEVYFKVDSECCIDVGDELCVDRCFDRNGQRNGRRCDERNDERDSGPNDGRNDDRNSSSHDDRYLYRRLSDYLCRHE